MVYLNNKLHKTLLSIAVFVVLGHSIAAHHHHEELVSDQHYVGPNDHHEHSLFSFGHLDEDYIQSNVQHSFINYIVLPGVAIFQISNDNTPVLEKTNFPNKEEYPPPDNYLLSFSLRGPPATV